MSARVNSFLVVLEKDITEEEAEQIKKAIALARGVIKVTLCETDYQTVVATSRAKHELEEKILEALKNW